MKKLRFILVSICLLLIGCKTKQVAVHTEKQNQVADISNMVENREVSQTANQSATNTAEIKELTELLQNLNVSYAGEDINDKLDLLLSKSENGTKLTISGKGTANYSDSQKTNIESLKTALYTRQDSLHSVELNYLQDLNAKIDSYIKEKNKDAKTKGFQFGFWAVLAVCLSIWIVLNLVLKRFKK